MTWFPGNGNASYSNSMFELTMATPHTHLLPTIFMQAVNDISNFHHSLLARCSSFGYQHMPQFSVGKSLRLTRSITFKLSGPKGRSLFGSGGWP